MVTSNTDTCLYKEAITTASQHEYYGKKGREQRKELMN